MKLELKICERCGKLWLRPAAKRWAYCRPCLAKVHELPPVKLRPQRTVPRRKSTEITTVQ
jgi:hypothetical protein